MTASPPDTAYGFARPPEPKSIGNLARGQEIVSGHWRLGGAEIDGTPFDSGHPGFEAEFNGFAWLDDLAAVGSALARGRAQDLTLDWLRRHPHVPVTPPPGDEAPQWRPDICGRRVLRWVFHAGQILPGLDRTEGAPYFDSLHAQLQFLSSQWTEATPGLPRTEALAGLSIAALSLRGAGVRVAPALQALARESVAVLGQGTLPSRNPEELLNAHALLVWVAEAAHDAGEDVPAGIPALIDRIAPVLRALRHADGGLARFHGGGRGAPGRLDHVLRAARGPALPEPGLAMGYARMARGRTTLILDAAAPPRGPAAATAHASTLGFELTSGRRPLIVNCGSGKAFGENWARAARATPCHSTLGLRGLSSARLLSPAQPGGPEFLSDLPGHVWAGTCDAQGNLHAPDFGPAHAGDTAHLLAGHDGYVATHGLTHMRELWLDPFGRILRGEDSLAALDDEARARLDARPDREDLMFDIRFHLHPDVQARQQDDTMILSLPSDETWYFRHDNVAEMWLEPSAWLETGAPAPRPSYQIVLCTSLFDYACQIGWTLAKSHDTPMATRDTR